jgi:hypothetical protein
MVDAGRCAVYLESVMTTRLQIIGGIALGFILVQVLARSLNGVCCCVMPLPKGDQHRLWMLLLLEKAHS